MSDWSAYRNGLWMGHALAVESAEAAVECVKARCHANLRDGTWTALLAPGETPLVLGPSDADILDRADPRELAAARLTPLPSRIIFGTTPTGRTRPDPSPAFRSLPPSTPEARRVLDALRPGPVEGIEP
jgi:hypothetical protein